MLTKLVPDPARDEEPHEVLALAADVEEPAAEGERDGETRQDQGRRLEECLGEVVRRRVRGVDVPGVREPVQPCALHDVAVGEERVVPRGEDDEPSDRERERPP